MRDLKLLSRLLIKVEVAVHEADFHEIKVHEVRDETSDDEDSSPDLQFRARVRLGTLWLVVAFWTCHPVSDGQPNRQDNVEQQGTKKHDFKGFHDIVCAHEIAEGVVPRTTVVAKDEQVGAGMEQQEKAQKST